jgi:hypothetical protein
MIFRREHEMLLILQNSSTVAPCGSHPGLTHGGNHEERILRSPSGDQIATGRSLSRVHLPDPRPFARLVSFLVAALPSTGGDRPLRLNPCQSPTTTHRSRRGTGDSRHSATSRIAAASSDSIQPDRCPCDLGRTQSITGAARALRAHHRTRLGAQRCHDAPGALSTLSADANLSHIWKTRSTRNMFNDAWEV